MIFDVVCDIDWNLQILDMDLNEVKMKSVLHIYNHYAIDWHQECANM